MTDETAAGKPIAQTRSAGGARRKIYIKERLPAILAEVKSLNDERKELAAKRQNADPEARKQLNRRWNFLVERLAVLRDERAALIGERDGLPSQVASAKPEDE